jgi:hypothetical protein
MNAKQTAVEWLVSQIDDESFPWLYKEEITQAKEMEKQQMKEYWNKAIKSVEQTLPYSERYGHFDLYFNCNEL